MIVLYVIIGILLNLYIPAWTGRGVKFQTGIGTCICMGLIAYYLIKKIDNLNEEIKILKNSLEKSRALQDKKNENDNLDN